jgi:hypothetical protein
MLKQGLMMQIQNRQYNSFVILQGNPDKNKKPNDPQKDIPAKPDKNPDPTTPKPGGNEPQKNDPTRIEEPAKKDTQRIVKPNWVE